MKTLVFKCFFDHKDVPLVSEYNDRVYVKVDDNFDINSIAYLMSGRDCDFSRVEIMDLSSTKVRYEYLISALYQSGVLYKIKELYINNKSDKKLPNVIYDELMECYNINVFECSSLDLAQYMSLSKVINYVFTNTSSVEFNYLKNFSLPKAGEDVFIGDGKFSFSNTKYATIFSIKSIFNISYAESELRKFFLIASNLEAIEFKLKNYGVKEFEFIKKLAFYASVYSDKPLTFTIKSDYDDQLFSTGELKGFSMLETYLKDFKIGLSFNVKNLYRNKKLEEIEKASRVFNENLSIILDPVNKFSEYEKYLLCYYFAKDHFYSSDSKNFLQDKNIIDLVNRNGGDCNAFDTLFNRYLSKCNIKHVPEQVLIYNKSTKKYEQHLRSIVRLVDKKYDIDNLFVADPTFGALTQKDGDRSFLFAHIMPKTEFLNVIIRSRSPLMQLLVLDKQNISYKELLANMNYYYECVKELKELGYISQEDKFYDTNYVDWRYQISFDVSKNIAVGNYARPSDDQINSVYKIIKDVKACDKIISFTNFADAASSIISKANGKAFKDENVFKYVLHNVAETHKYLKENTPNTFSIISTDD